MKTKLFNFIIIGTFLATGVVSAWEAPESNFPNGNANAPVHTGEFEQRKSGGLWAKYFHAGTSNTTEKLSAIIGDIAKFLAGDKMSVAPTAIFKEVFLPGKNAHLRVGTTQSDDNGANLFKAASETRRAPAVIDLEGRTGNHQVDALAMLKSSAICTADVAMVTNTPAFHFWSDKNNGSADLIARQIRLAGGNPTPGSVLVSVDGNGNAVWGIPKMVKDGNGWVLEYDYSESPVKVGANICKVPPAIEGCMDETASNYNKDATVDDGSCKYKEIKNQPYCNDPKASNGMSQQTINDLINTLNGNQSEYTYVAVVDNSLCKYEQKPTQWIDYVEYGKDSIFSGNLGETCKSWVERSGRDYPDNFYGVVAQGAVLSNVIFNVLDPGAPAKTGPGLCLYANANNDCREVPITSPSPGSGYRPVSACKKVVSQTSCQGPWGVWCINSNVQLQFVVGEVEPPYTPVNNSYWDRANKVIGGILTKGTKFTPVSLDRTGNTTCYDWLGTFGYNSSTQFRVIKKGIVNVDWPSANNINPFDPTKQITTNSCLYTKISGNNSHAQCIIIPAGQKPPKTGVVYAPANQCEGGYELEYYVNNTNNHDVQKKDHLIRKYDNLN